MPEMTYLQAISDALREEMRADERVLLMGEDIGAFGGAFKVTDGFQEEFGADRVMDTPLAESGIIGTAIGAAVAGLRPVCEMQFADFISCGFDQLVNVAGKMYYRQGLPVNITVRLPSGDETTGTVFYRGVDAGFATQRDVSRTKRDIKTFEVRLRVDNTNRRLAVGMTMYVNLPVAK